MPAWVEAALLAPASAKRAHLPPIMFALYYALLKYVRTSSPGRIDGVDLEIGQTNVSEETLVRAIGLPVSARQQIRTALDEMVRRRVIARANPTKTQATITLVGFRENQHVAEQIQPSIQPSWVTELAAKMWAAVRLLRSSFAAKLYMPGTRSVVPMPTWESAFESRDRGALELAARIAQEGDPVQARRICEHVLGHLEQQADLEYTCKWLSAMSFTAAAWSFARNSVDAKPLSLDIQPSPNQDPTPNENLEREHTQDHDRGLALSLPPDPGHDSRGDLVHAPRPATSPALVAAALASVAPAPRPSNPSRRGALKPRPPAIEELERLLELPASVRTPKNEGESHAEWSAREQRERHALYEAFQSAARG